MERRTSQVSEVPNLSTDQVEHLRGSYFFPPTGKGMVSSSSEQGHGAGAKVVVVHDVMGTLFCFDAAIEALKRVFADQLEGEDERAELVIMDWCVYCTSLSNERQF
jgi:hypothetical protein